MILVVLTYLAGVLTILSPCILPVLPFVFSRAQQSFVKNGLPLLAGMCLTFSVLSAAALIGGEWIGRANEVGRTVAMLLMAAFGLSLLFPALSDKIFEPITRIGSRIGQTAKPDGFGGSFVIGMSTGLLWAPCAGPILGLVLTGAATQGNLTRSIVLLLSYSLGAATSLALALVAGNRFLGTLKKSLSVDQVVKKFLGAAVLLGVVAIVFHLDRTLLTQLSKLETASFESKLLALAGIEKPDGKESNKILPSVVFPDLALATGWINSQPLKQPDLAGKVVLIDFWTYSCINCLRTLPYVKTWYTKYKNKGFEIIGVHTPEFGFEKNIDNVKKAVQDLGVTYPVAIDNDYKIWKAMGNHYWPAHFFFDRQGRLRHEHHGEGAYDESEEMIRTLLTENGQTDLPAMGVNAADASGVEAAPSAGSSSPETYIGYNWGKNIRILPELAEDEATVYRLPGPLQLNEWGLVGKWLIEKERAILKAASAKSPAKIVFRFKARDLHLVLGAADKTISYRVKLDGAPPGDDHGADVDRDGSGQIHGQRLYQLIRQKGAAERLFEIEFDTPGAEAYAFTFG